MFIRRMPRIAKPRRISSRPARPDSLLPPLSGIDLATCMGRISVPHSALPDEQGGQRLEPEGSEVTGISQEEKVKSLAQGQAQERRPGQGGVAACNQRIRQTAKTPSRCGSFLEGAESRRVSFLRWRELRSPRGCSGAACSRCPS